MNILFQVSNLPRYLSRKLKVAIKLKAIIDNSFALSGLEGR
jgi:hypothetical protein